MEQVEIGVIGGSGLYNMPEVTDKKRYAIETPFGSPSAEITVGTLRGRRVAFVPRHGEGHVYSPEAIPQRANIFALKKLGVNFIIAVNACGSLREDYAPGHLVIPDQLFDYTIGKRNRSFFMENIVAHVSVAEPFCTELRELLVKSVQEAGGTVHGDGTLLVEDGPRFATKAESNIFRHWGCDIIGMTSCPEAFLAREAEIAYASMAHITDYDVWHETEEAVTVEMVMNTMKANLEIAREALAYAVENLDLGHRCSCHTALDNAIMSDRSKMPADLLEEMKPIVGRALDL